MPTPPRVAAHVLVDPGAEAAQHVEHQPDDDEIHPEVEEQRGDELDRTQHRQVETISAEDNAGAPTSSEAVAVPAERPRPAPRILPASSGRVSPSS